MFVFSAPDTHPITENVLSHLKDLNDERFGGQLQMNCSEPHTLLVELPDDFSEPDLGDLMLQLEDGFNLRLLP